TVRHVWKCLRVVRGRLARELRRRARRRGGVGLARRRPAGRAGRAPPRAPRRQHHELPGVLPLRLPCVGARARPPLRLRGFPRGAGAVIQALFWSTDRFAAFGPSHLTVLAAMLAGSLALVSLGRRAPAHPAHRALPRLLGAVIVLSEIVF